MQSVVHGALRKRVWIVIVSSCATQRLRKALILVVLLGGVPPSTASTALEAANDSSMTGHAIVESAQNYVKNSPWSC